VDMTNVNKGNNKVPKTKNRQASDWASPPPQKLALTVSMAGPVIHIPRTANSADGNRSSCFRHGHQTSRKKRTVAAGSRNVMPIASGYEKQTPVIQWTAMLGAQNTIPPSRA